MPTPNAAGTPGFFAHGTPGGAPYTILTSDWANAVQMEICNVITGAGISLSKTNQSQLLAAINGLITAGVTAGQTNLGFTPVQQGGGTGQGANKVRIGWASDGSGLKVQVDSTDLGVVPFLNRANTWSQAQAFNAGLSALGITLSTDLSARDVSASRNIWASGAVTGLDISATRNISASNTIYGQGGLSSGAYVNATSSMYAGTTIQAAGALSGNTVAANNGNVTANNGRFRASFGHGGDANAAPILADFGNIGSFGAFIIQGPKFLMQGVTVSCWVGDFALSQPVGQSAAFNFAWPTVFPEVCCSAWGVGVDSGPQEGSEMGIGMVNFTNAGGTFRANRISGSNSSPSPGGETFIAQVIAVGR